VKLSEVVICWTPDRPEYQAGMRGKARIFSATAGRDDVGPFPCRAGHVDPRAHEPRLELREAYVMGIANVMSQRDGLEVSLVHRLLLRIDEYRSGCAPELLNAMTEGEQP
jgi:hypothetical protein